MARSDYSSDGEHKHSPRRGRSRSRSRSRSPRRQTVVPSYSSSSASSVYANDLIGVKHGQGQLDSLQAWSAGKKVEGEYWQVDLGKMHKVAGVKIQGRHDMDQWITGFKVRLSNDQDEWYWADKGKVFSGNADRSSIHTVMFNDSYNARHIRFVATTWHNYISGRFAVVVLERSRSHSRTRRSANRINERDRRSRSRSRSLSPLSPRAAREKTNVDYRLYSDLELAELLLNVCGEDSNKKSIMEKNIEIVKSLIAAGVDLNATYDDGTSALCLALNSQYKIAELLVDHGCDVNLYPRGGFTPLMRCAQYGLSKMCVLLLAEGADVFHKNLDGKTALTFAEQNENKEIAKILRKAIEERGPRKYDEEKEKAKKVQDINIKIKKMQQVPVVAKTRAQILQEEYRKHERMEEEKKLRLRVKKTTARPKSDAPTVNRLSKPIKHNPKGHFASSIDDSNNCSFMPKISAGSAKIVTGTFLERLPNSVKKFENAKAIRVPLDPDCTFKPKLSNKAKHVHLSKPVLERMMEDNQRRILKLQTAQDADLPPPTSLEERREAAARFQERMEDDMEKRNRNAYYRELQESQRAAEALNANKPQHYDPRSKEEIELEFMERMDADLRKRRVKEALRDELFGNISTGPANVKNAVKAEIKAKLRRSKVSKKGKQSRKRRSIKSETLVEQPSSASKPSKRSDFETVSSSDNDVVDVTKVCTQLNAVDNLPLQEEEAESGPDQYSEPVKKLPTQTKSSQADETQVSGEEEKISFGYVDEQYWSTRMAAKSQRAENHQDGLEARKLAREKFRQFVHQQALDEARYCMGEVEDPVRIPSPRRPEIQDGAAVDSPSDLHNLVMKSPKRAHRPANLSEALRVGHQDVAWGPKSPVRVAREVPDLDAAKRIAREQFEALGSHSEASSRHTKGRKKKKSTTSGKAAKEQQHPRRRRSTSGSHKVQSDRKIRKRSSAKAGKSQREASQDRSDVDQESSSSEHTQLSEGERRLPFSPAAEAPNPSLSPQTEADNHSPTAQPPAGIVGSYSDGRDRQSEVQYSSRRNSRDELHHSSRRTSRDEVQRSDQPPQPRSGSNSELRDDQSVHRRGSRHASDFQDDRIVDQLPERPKTSRGGSSLDPSVRPKTSRGMSNSLTRSSRDLSTANDREAANFREVHTASRDHLQRISQDMDDFDLPARKYSPSSKERDICTSEQEYDDPGWHVDNRRRHVRSRSYSRYQGGRDGGQGRATGRNNFNHDALIHIVSPTCRGRSNASQRGDFDSGEQDVLSPSTRRYRNKQEIMMDLEFNNDEEDSIQKLLRRRSQRASVRSSSRAFDLY